MTESLFEISPVTISTVQSEVAASRADIFAYNRDTLAEAEKFQPHLVRQFLRFGRHLRDPLVYYTAGSQTLKMISQNALQTPLDSTDAQRAFGFCQLGVVATNQIVDTDQLRDNFWVKKLAGQEAAKDYLDWLWTTDNHYQTRHGRYNFAAGGINIILPVFLKETGALDS